jgi:hypothetical protein
MLPQRAYPIGRHNIPLLMAFIVLVVITIIFELLLRQLAPLPQRGLHVVVLAPPLLKAPPLHGPCFRRQRLAITACVASVATAAAYSCFAR